jgi:hypothetical protein
VPVHGIDSELRESYRCFRRGGNVNGILEAIGTRSGDRWLNDLSDSRLQ